MAALLSQEKIPRNLIDTAIRMAESVADELTRGDDREVSMNFTSFNIFCFFRTICRIHRFVRLIGFNSHDFNLIHL